MCAFPSVSTAPSHSSIVSPPQNCSKIVDLINPSTGKPIDRANFVRPEPIEFRKGEFKSLKSRYFRSSCASDLSAKAVAVSSKSSSSSLIKIGFYHISHRVHRANESLKHTAKL